MKNENKENISIKERIVKLCQIELQARIQTAKMAVESAQQASNSETKSSAGDKYETGRAMAQLEKERHARVLASLEDDLNTLLSVGIRPPQLNVREGSLVYTNRGIYFIAFGFGAVKVDDLNINVISVLSPIGQILLDLEVEDEEDFRGSMIEVIKIE